MNLQEAIALWRADAPMREALGISLPDVRAYLPDEFKLATDSALRMTMDALPTLSTTPSAGIPALLTTMIDPNVFRIVFAPTKAAEIFGEVRKGTWVDETALFPIIEHVGEVSSYGDFNENGHTGANMDWPARQAYRFQTVKEYGDLEIERAGRGLVNWVAELDQAAATVLQRYLNQTYLFGVNALQNYGLLNDPSLPASLTPSVKAAPGAGNRWVVNGVIVATANEIYADIQSLVMQLVTQTAGLVDKDSSMTLVLSPAAEVALTATNTFNVNVTDLLKKNFPNLKVMTAVQYALTTTQNPQGSPTGNLVQLIADNIDGQKTGYAAFNEKMKAFPIIRAMSSYKQKVMSGTWGAIVRMPVAFASMIGV